MKNNHRQYNNSYPSVTKVLDVLRKIGLEQWFKNNTPEFIEEASSKGKLIGKQLHEAIQAHIEDESFKIETQYVEEIKNALKSFMLFKKEHKELKLKRAEIQMTSEKYKCNGTLDCLGSDGKEVIFDWKTGQAKDKSAPAVYDEYIYQVSAYVNFYNEIHKKEIKKAYILALAKDKIAYNLQVVSEEEIEGSFKGVFLPALKIWQYQHRGK